MRGRAGGGLSVGVTARPGRRRGGPVGPVGLEVAGGRPGQGGGGRGAAAAVSRPATRAAGRPRSAAPGREP